MKILHVLDDSIYRFGGVQYYILNFAEWLVEQGHEVTIVFPENKNVTPRKLNQKIKLIELTKAFDLKGVRFNGNFAMFPAIVSRKKIRVLLENNFDAVHFHYPYSPLFSGRILSEIQKLQSKPKTICTFQIYVEEKKLAQLGNKALGRYLKKNLEHIDTFTHDSLPCKEYGLKYTNKESVFMPPSIPPINALEKPSYKNPDKKLTLIFLGRFEHRKGVIDLIEALNIVNKRLDLKQYADIFMVGDGVLKPEAEALAKNYDLQIKFPGRVSTEERDKVYLDADLCIFPAKYGESTGVVLIEAMNYGCSIIGYDNPGYADTLKGFEDSLVPVNDIEQLANRIEKFIQNKDTYIFELGRKLKENFDNKFNIETTGPKLLEIYRKF
jgi:phosphatidyl-myo-inositol alpha-mannosyltransferase